MGKRWGRIDWGGVNVGLSLGEGLLGADVFHSRASCLSGVILPVETRGLSRLIAGTIICPFTLCFFTWFQIKAIFSIILLTFIFLSLDLQLYLVSL